MDLHLHLRGRHDSLWHPLYHGALKRRLHVREAGRTKTGLSLSHSAADPYIGDAGRGLEWHSAARHGGLRNLRRKWSLSKWLLEKTVVIKALWELRNLAAQ